MKPLNLIHAVLAVGLTAILVAGCSVRLVPLDQPADGEQTDYEREAAYYGNDYGDGGLPPPPYTYDVWQMSQYYRYVDELRYSSYAPEWSNLPPNRMNIDPNPNDSYSAGEPPIRRASLQRSAQSTETYQRNSRLTEQRQNRILSQRADDRSHQDSRTTSVNTPQEKERDVRQKLKQRRDQVDQNSKMDEEREAQRRKVRERTRR